MCVYMYVCVFVYIYMIVSVQCSNLLSLGQSAVCSVHMYIYTYT